MKRKASFRPSVCIIYLQRRPKPESGDGVAQQLMNVRRTRC
jgi:hypothetical protein